MLQRQSVLLGLLARANRPWLRVELLKWAFVLKHETASAGGSAFYEFFPYKKGPYSFNLKREIDHLAEAGAVLATEAGWQWDVKLKRLPLPRAVDRDVNTIAARLRNIEPNALLRTLYERYPEYTVNSEIERRAERPVAVPAIYTAGYEGFQIDAFLNRLIRAGIRKLIDVRHNPIARR